jgi:nucleotide-binding universal stress UspA family protein
MIVQLAIVSDPSVPQDPAMAATVIVSYDGTTNDDDALALGQMLCPEPGALALAYVRHSREYDPRREEIAQHDAQRRLDHGSEWLKDSAVTRHVVINPSTGQGLAGLAAEEAASVVVFGSDYRTSPGRVEPGASAQVLLNGGTAAVAVAPAGLRTRGHGRIEKISVIVGEDDDAAGRTANSLAERLGATATGTEDPQADLVIIGSGSSASDGRISLSSAARGKLDGARSSVLVLPRGVAVLF